MAEIARVGLVAGEAEGQGGAALPPVIRRARECGMCFQNAECMLYHRAAEGGDDESSGLERGVFDSKVGRCVFCVSTVGVSSVSRRERRSFEQCTPFGEAGIVCIVCRSSIAFAKAVVQCGVCWGMWGGKEGGMSGLRGRAGHVWEKCRLST